MKYWKTPIYPGCAVLILLIASLSAPAANYVMDFQHDRATALGNLWGTTAAEEGGDCRLYFHQRPLGWTAGPGCAKQGNGVPQAFHDDRDACLILLTTLWLGEMPCPKPLTDSPPTDEPPVIDDDLPPPDPEIPHLPEPSTLLLGLMGAGLVGWRLRQSRAKKHDSPLALSTAPLG
ncbi:MAG: PEP-CTERM sorting domain-containing protein [Gemmataceae bacterium]